jgi:hypothetical protein
MAAAQGNQYAAKAKQWQMAIERALEKRGASDRRAALDELAAVLLDKAAEGDMTALKELGDRLDGKPAQTIGSDPDQPLRAALSLEVVGVKAKPAE